MGLLDERGRRGVGGWAFAVALSGALLAAGLAGANVAAANHYDFLLPPQGSAACPNQRDVTATLREQKRSMQCLHRYARAHAGIPSDKNVRPHQTLRDAAQAKAADMMRCQQFSHQACGHPVWYWPDYFGYDSCRALAENISWASGANASARSVMSAWLHSDQHRTTILRMKWRDIGAGMRRGNFKGNPRSQVWVVLLGRQYPPTRCAVP